MEQVININNLSVCYGSRTAIRITKATFSTGITALLGPNGSGKSTLLRCLAGVLEPANGVVYYCGHPIASDFVNYRMHLGYLPQDFVGYEHMTVCQFLSYIAALKLIDYSLVANRVTEVVAMFRLDDYVNTKIKNLSRGLMQRVGLAQAMLNDPDVLLLDEPSFSLDIEEQHELFVLLGAIAHERVIVFSTHNPSEAELCADKIAILSQGTLLCQLPLQDLHSRYPMLKNLEEIYMTIIRN